MNRGFLEIAHPPSEHLIITDARYETHLCQLSKRNYDLSERQKRWKASRTSSVERAHKQIILSYTTVHELTDPARLNTLMRWSSGS